MSWSRSQYQKKDRRPRHAQVSLCIVHCVECQRPLQATHVVLRFGERCRKCFDAFLDGAREMASR